MTDQRGHSSSNFYESNIVCFVLLGSSENARDAAHARRCRYMEMCREALPKVLSEIALKE